MRGAYGFTASSRLDAPAEDVWRTVVSVEGMRHELAPIMRMTAPKQAREITEENVVLGRRMFRSWVLLFGILPIDYDDITVVALQPGRSFEERSPMMHNREWVHKRRVDPADGGCVLTDEIAFVPRLRITAPLYLAVVRRLFRHRHRRLRQMFGGAVLVEP